ncbi:hypothetical protein NMY22_g4244 [Coprinellus aureogranulatus]|nr:hypothetical protein NMY22_g4244 [Coprinellus aureogranulatus]
MIPNMLKDEAMTFQERLKPPPPPPPARVLFPSFLRWYASLTRLRGQPKRSVESASAVVLKRVSHSPCLSYRAYIADDAEPHRQTLPGDTASSADRRGSLRALTPPIDSTLSKPDLLPKGATSASSASGFTTQVSHHPPLVFACRHGSATTHYGRFLLTSTPTPSSTKLVDEFSSQYKPSTRSKATADSPWTPESPSFGSTALYLLVTSTPVPLPQERRVIQSTIVPEDLEICWSALYLFLYRASCPALHGAGACCSQFVNIQFGLPASRPLLSRVYHHLQIATGVVDINDNCHLPLFPPSICPIFWLGLGLNWAKMLEPADTIDAIRGGYHNTPSP